MRYPLDNSTGASPRPTLMWNKGGGGDPAEYEVIISRNQNLANSTSYKTISTFFDVSTVLSLNEKYYWTAIPLNDAGSPNITDAPVWSFTVVNPATPNLTTPANNAEEVLMLPTLVWDIITPGTHYELILSEKEDFSAPIFQEVRVADNFTLNPPQHHTLSLPLKSSTKYFWKVNPVYGNYIHDNTPVRSFSTTSGNPVIIGNGNNTNQSLPYNPAHPYSFTQTIYLANELGLKEGDVITKLCYYFGGSDIRSMLKANITVSIGFTDKTGFLHGDDWLPPNDINFVKAEDLPLEITNGTGWDIIELKSSPPVVVPPGDKNIIICVEYQNTTAAVMADNYYCTGVDYNQSITYVADSINMFRDQLPNGKLSKMIPNTIFIIDEKSHDTTEQVVNYRNELIGNYPNPFNPNTVIKFGIYSSHSSSNTPQHVKLDIYNIKGQRIRTLVNREYPSGEHSVAWNGKDDNGQVVGSGIYFCRMITGGDVMVRKMVMIK